MHDITFTGAFGVILAIAWAAFWVFQFVRLMGRPHDAFAGPWDKYAWVAVFLIVWPLAPFAYLASDYLADRSDRRRRRMDT